MFHIHIYPKILIEGVLTYKYAQSGILNNLMKNPTNENDYR